MNPDWVPRCPIICMVGDCTGERDRVWYKKLGWGRMYSRGRPDPYEREPWGLDNGAWSAYYADGGAEFPEEEFIKRLAQARRQAEARDAPPYLAVAPDVVMGGMSSLDFSLEWLRRLRDELGYGDWYWYLAIQPGMTYAGVEAVAGEFDGLFLGGGNEQKSSARVWQALARDHDLPFHYGRCGTRAKLNHAFELGVDSLDSAGPRRSRYSLRQFLLHYKFLAERYYPDLNGGE